MKRLPACCNVASLITAVVLLLGAGLTPATALADSDGLTQGNEITTELQPGWNMSGWLGAETPVAHLFDAIPALTRASMWDATEDRYRRASRGHYNEFQTLTRGLAVWLHLAGDAPAVWERPATPDSAVVRLREGRNLVAWAGSDSPVADTLARLGDSLVRAARWDADRQEFELYDAAPTHFTTTLGALERGDALWIELSSDANFWVAGTEQPTFRFSDDIAVEDQQRARRLVERVRAVFAEQFGMHTADFTASFSTDPGCYVGNSFFQVPLGSADYCVSHDYFRMLQFELAGGHSPGPGWMVQGAASYARGVYDETAKEGADRVQGYDRARRFALIGSVHVPSLEDPQDERDRASDHLGFLATEWLVGFAGPAALHDYYALVASSEDWESAFEAAFGLSIDDFYATFEAHRATIAPPLPHLTDDVVKPVAAFLGDVPAATRATIQAELDTVHEFFSGRLGAEPAEYTVYVGANSAVSRSTFNRLFMHGTVEDNCSIVGEVMMHVITCRSQLSYSSYVDLYLRTILARKYYGQPFWINVGIRSYIQTLHREAHEAPAPVPFDGPDIDEFRRRATIVQQLTVPLRHLAVAESWVTTNDQAAHALSFFAAHWLAQHTGERALMDFYRLLPDAGSWQAAFEQAFGLTIEDFYDAFAPYRARLSDTPHRGGLPLEPQ